MSGDECQGTVIFKSVYGLCVYGKVYFGRGAFGIVFVWEERGPWIEQEDRKLGTGIDTEGVY